jgi:tRNA-splicing ligase RtcB
MPGIPDDYKETGQPVILGGSMETGSYLLAGVGTAGQTFFTTAHGSGRAMSRTAARKRYRGRELQRRWRSGTTSDRKLVRPGREAGPAKDVDSSWRPRRRDQPPGRPPALVGNVKG